MRMRIHFKKNGGKTAAHAPSTTRNQNVRVTMDRLSKYSGIMNIAAT
eukprot:XP_001707956.1 Hypothetical protein GL50803_28060 [Giardia lamblia ATCC 50803]